MSRRGVAALAVALLIVACGSPFQVGPFPGTSWVDRAGDPVPPRVLALYADDCPGRESAAFLDVLWPLNPPPDQATHMRRFVRDPSAVMPTERLLAPYGAGSALPVGAQFSGYSAGDVQLWIGHDSDIYLYLVEGPRVEALARAVDENVGCTTAP